MASPRETVAHRNTGPTSQYVGVLRRPHVSEKAHRLASDRQYVFLVDPRATKRQIQEAVEHRYQVTVRAVQTTPVRGTTRRWRSSVGTIGAGKKATVTLQEGQKIELT